MPTVVFSSVFLSLAGTANRFFIHLLIHLSLEFRTVCKYLKNYIRNWIYTQLWDSVQYVKLLAVLFSIPKALEATLESVSLLFELTRFFLFLYLYCGRFCLRLAAACFVFLFYFFL